jgi:hypothetical protein
MKKKKIISIAPLLFMLMFFNFGLAQDQMKGKLMMGYQGWFLAQGDGSQPNDWRHWFRSTSTPSPDFFTIDMWPDMDEYTDTYNTNMAYTDGSNAQLFSSHDLSTTRKHFEWMRDYNIYGVHLQRFLSETADPRFFDFRNNVLQNVMTAADEYGRHFSVMYDLSGVPDDGNLYNKLITDWEYLIDTYDILNAPGYVKEGGRPVVAIWGIGFKNRGLNPTTFEAIIDYFHNTADPKYRAYIMGGVPDGWRTLSGSSETDPAWSNIYNSLDMISPWTVGRYSNNSGVDNWKNTRIVPDLQFCNNNGIDYMPVIWPGFSWKNLKGGTETINKIPRNRGEFYWRQAFNAIDAGVDYIYVAMFDEVDEATAMFKITETKAELPVQAQDILVPLDIDGTYLPSDWYLKLADETQKMLEGSIPLTGTIPISPTTPLGNGSQFISQQNIPTTMGLGETVTISVTFKNTGNITWTKADGYKLGSQNPEDNMIWGSDRVLLDDVDNILPNQEKTFQFDITSPSEVGTYYLQWQMIKEGVEWFGALSSGVPIIVGGGGNYLDSCDYDTDWQPSFVYLNTRDQVQGIACLAFTDDNTDEFRKVFSTPYNAFGTEAGTVLKFWYFVSDVTQFSNDNQVEIGSSGGPDINEYNWSLTGLTNSWNFIQLNTSNANKIGNPDLSAINWFRLYRFKIGTVTTRIDAIQLIGESLSTEEFDLDSKTKLYPNPTETSAILYLNLSKPSNINIEILNLLGQSVFQNKHTLSSGVQKIEMPMHNLKSGTYFARIKIDNSVFVKRIIKK